MPSRHTFNMLVTEEQVPEKVVGFIPLIPNPVTEYSTVYTCLKNFQNVLGQLDQSQIAVACDEGVYRIAREIMLNNPSEFQDIVLVLGSFHMIKVVLGCLGKYLQGSGAEALWTENAVFGMKVVETVLSGSNYNRAVKGMFMLSEALDRLRWMMFFKAKGTEQYRDVLQKLQGLKESASAKDREQCKEKM